MKILLTMVRPEFTISVALHDDEEMVSVGLVGKPVVVSLGGFRERTIKAGYWEVTGGLADYIATTAKFANDNPTDLNLNQVLTVLGHCLPYAEETVPLSKVEEVATNCGIKMSQFATRYHCEWFESVLHKIGAQCGAMYSYDALRLVLETVKESQEEITRRKGVLSPNPPIKPIPVEESYDFNEDDLLPACPKCAHGMAHPIVIKGPLTCLSCGYAPTAPRSIPHPRSMENVRR